MEDLDRLSALELRRLISTRAISPVEVTRRALDQAEASQATLNAFAHLMPESALAAARAAEAAVMAGGPLGLLHGLPVSVKDLIAVAGAPQRFGSRATNDADVTADAPSVERLRAAGAIIIGKTTTSEFGCKAVGDSPLTGVTRNPLNPAFTPGGSSAGAAASVAAGITALALGTDGGGSIRIPAALCGLFGIKANFGRVPVHPVSATPTLAHVAPIARSVADAALMLTAITGFDPRDATSIAGPTPDYLGACQTSIAGLRVAWSPTLGYANPTAEIVEICAAAARRFEALGAHVELVERVFDEDPVALWSSEFYAGVGTRLRATVETQRDLLDPAVAALLDQALRQDMRGYYETVFQRHALRDRMRLFFERFDLILSPTLPVASVEVGRDVPLGFEGHNPVSWVSYTYPFNLTGQPAASIRAGTATNGMPIGLQIVGGLHRETDVLAAAAAFERASGSL